MPIHFLSRQEHSHCQCNTYCYYLFIIGIVTIYMLLCCFLYFVSQPIFFGKWMSGWRMNATLSFLLFFFSVLYTCLFFFRESHRVTHFNSWQEHVIVLFGTFDWLLVPVTWAHLQKKSDKKCTIISKMYTSFVET